MIYESISIDEHSDRPMYRQLYDSIKESICCGELPVGTKLPSIRRISEALGISRTTSEQAYAQLCVEGYIISRPQSGYYVEAISEKSCFKAKDIIDEKNSNEYIRYDFGSRYVDSRSSDVDLWRKYVRSVLSREDIVNSYGHYQGEPLLRRQLVNYGSAMRGVHATVDRIVVGAGVQPLLSILCGLLGENTGRVGIEYPCFAQAERVFRDFRLNIAELQPDRFGVRASDLYSSKIDLLYLNPSNTESMGRPMPISRRTELLDWAEKTNGLIIEDDYNGALRFRSRPVPAMQGMSNGDRVIYLGSFSKLLMPSVRISYMILPPALAELYLKKGKNYNQTSSKIEQLALAEYMRDGHIEKRLRRLRKLYSQKSELMMSALNEYLGDNAEFSIAETALCINISLKSHLDTNELSDVCLSRGVRIIPTVSDDRTRFMLSFAGIPQNDISDGIRILAEVISELT